MQPYHIQVDSKHNVWGDLWTNDQIYRYDPTAKKWTTFELAGARHRTAPHLAR
jgi:streptogramin lyase